jgi:hypothetical protein
MSSKYGVLCFLALLLVLLLMIKNYEIWTQPVEWVPEENAAKRPQTKPENKPEVLSTFGTQKNSAYAKPYASISEKNIFNPDRKDFPSPIGTAGRQLVRPQIVLYGVTIIGNYKAASIASPGRPLQRGERETFTVKVGERVGEYKLAEIFSDRVKLEAEGDTFEVLLYDQLKSKRRSDIRTESKPATITSTQPVPSTPAPGTPIPTPASPIPPTAVPQPTPPAGTGQAGVITRQPASPVSPTPPRTDFPRRRPYYPPSVPSQKTEGN